MLDRKIMFLLFHWFFSFTAAYDLDDDFLHDPRYTEMFKETYLRPIDGHRVFAIQPGISISISTLWMDLSDCNLCHFMYFAYVLV